MNRLLTRIPVFPVWPEEIEIDGIRILLKESPLSPQMRRRLMKGLYETAERELIQTFIRPGEQILEIGASIGIVTSFLVKAAGVGGRVVSVEPDATFQSYFERQLALNGARPALLHALCCPVWQQPVPESLAGQTFVHSGNNLSGRIAKTAGAGTPVRWITAEQACSETGLEPTAIMVDIEGTEAVWSEHRPLFPRSLRTIILEVHPHLTGPQRAGRVVQAVVGEGFRVAALRSNVFAFER